MHVVLVNRLGGLSLPRKSVVRLTDHPDMTLDVYRGRKTTIQQQQNKNDDVTKPAAKNVKISRVTKFKMEFLKSIPCEKVYNKQIFNTIA